MFVCVGDYVGKVLAILAISLGTFLSFMCIVFSPLFPISLVL